MPHRPFPPHFVRLALCIGLLLPGVLRAQAPVDDYAPRTGDAWIDRALRDVNDYAARYPDSFVDEVSRYLGVSREYAQALLAQPGWRAGDVQFACALAKASAQSCRGVVRARAQDYARDWRGVARDLGVRAGYGEYQRVRAAIRASYAHWARPLPEE